ncbi:MAG TPA: hypothetical protein VD763_07490 [Candidatus Saccharimonadales bacterium]|nr:hypothetical protein [Candidatus Saccharimonadales bacterium]
MHGGPIVGYVAVLIIGLILLALGAQSGIRLLLDGADAGVLGWLPGGTVAQLLGYVALAIAGIALAAWGRDRAKRDGHLP